MFLLFKYKFAVKGVKRVPDCFYKWLKITDACRCLCRLWERYYSKEKSKYNETVTFVKYYFKFTIIYISTSKPFYINDQGA